MSEDRKKVIRELMADLPSSLPWFLQITSAEDGTTKEIRREDIIRYPDNLAYLLQVVENKLTHIIGERPERMEDIQDAIDFLRVLRAIALSEAERSPDGFWPEPPHR